MNGALIAAGVLLDVLAVCRTQPWGLGIVLGVLLAGYGIARATQPNR